MKREELLSAAANEVRPCGRTGCPNMLPVTEPPFCGTCSILLLEILTKEKCSLCGGTGEISIGGGCMGYDDEPCPKCTPRSTAPETISVLLQNGYGTVGEVKPAPDADLTHNPVARGVNQCGNGDDDIDLHTM